MKILRKKATIAGIILLAVVLFLLRPKALVALDTYTVSRHHLVQSLSVSGSIVAKKSVDLAFTTSGKLVYLGVQKGDTVAQYQTIASLDQRTVQKNLESTLIDYSKQRNTFDQTQDNNANRTPEQALNDSMKRILQNNQYDLNKAILSVELQNLARDSSVLVSPISGIVSRADAKSSGVNVTTSTIFTIVDPTSLVFNADVDEADVSRIQIGDRTTLTLDSYSDKPFDSIIRSIDFVSHTTSTGGTAYTVEVGLDTSLPYRVGMNGNADIVLAERYHAKTIPISSIIDENNVYVKTKDGYVVRKVVLGIQNDTDAEILSGLSDKDIILTQSSMVPKPSSLSKIPLVGRFFK